MTAITWSPESIRDVESIRRFIAQDSPAYAELVVRRIVAAVERLTQFPESGRIVPERHDLNIREIIVAPFRVGGTVDRSVLGIMVDFAKSVPHYLEAGGWNDTALRVVEDRLAETPCHAGKTSDRLIFPDKKARELLAAKWAS